MGEVMARKARLEKLMGDIRKGLEEFYHVGMSLREIRDDELYREAGFDSFLVFCKAEFEYAERHVYHLMKAADYRIGLPPAPTAPGVQYQWSERAVRELTRIPDKRQAARVAAKAIAAIEQSVKSATKNGGVKLPTLTATVRRFVDADLGVKRGAAPKVVTPPPQAGGRNLLDYLEDRIGAERSVLAVLRSSMTRIRGRSSV
jgi:hypothetical protein